MSIRFLCAIILLPNVLSSSLNCTFDAQCCWFSRHGLTPWKITNGGSTNVSSRRTFHTEKSKGSLTIRGESSQLSGNNFISVTMAPNETISAEWTSCPFCSRSGLVTIKLMAWHSPTADLQLCWRFKGNTEMQTKKCATVRRWTQFGYTISRFAVPRERRLQFYIQMVNKESRSTAIAVIDRILVETSLCNQVYPKQQLNSAAKKSSSSNAPLAHRYIKEPPKSTSPASFNPLSEIFGKEFAEFLREDYDTTEQDRAELEAARLRPHPETEVSQSQKPDDPILHLLSGGLFDIDSLRCNTTGGCLFDRSMCSYRNSDLADKASFRMVSVLNQHFVQASVPPGGIAILEVETRFHEAHLVVFDLLEFSEGGKLSACCLKPQNQPQELFCPFASESQATPVLWHTSRITCPSGTTKLMFVCENYGQLQGSCSIDNIRLHKTVDVLELEPCQKNTLRST